MNKIDNIINNIRFKNIEALDRENRFELGYYKGVGLKKALLLEGKVLRSDVAWATSSLINRSSFNPVAHICAQTADQKLMIYDYYGDCLTPNGLVMETAVTKYDYRTPFMYGTILSSSEILVNNVYGGGKMIINVKDRSISPVYNEVYNVNKYGQRVIRHESGLYYYIDNDFNVISHPFIYETNEDKNGNKIRRYFSIDNKHVDAIVKNGNTRVSNFFTQIKYESPNVFLGYNEKDKSYTYLDINGKEIISTNQQFSNVAVRERKIRNAAAKSDAESNTFDM